MSYRTDLKIDRYNLDDELVRQPQLYMQYALRAAEASIEKQEAKDRLEIVKADLDGKIRTDPDKYNIPEGKASEGAIKAKIAKHSKVKRYNRLYLKALKNEKFLNEAKVAFTHRKKMLEALVSLNIQLHFAEPKVPVGQKEVIHRARKSAILDDLKRKRKIKRRD